MADNAARRRRGTETQVAIAEYLHRIFPHATDAGMGRKGRDILNTGDTSWEVKARRDLDPLAWMRQARQAEGLPIVAFRPDGAGPATVEDWPCILRLKDVVDLLIKAGYTEDSIPTP